VRAVEADVVVARAEGYATAVTRSPQSGRAYELQMLRGARVQIRFLDQAGQPVAGVSARAWQRSLASAGDVTVEEGRTRRPSQMVVDVRDVVATAVSNDDGVADLGTLLAGRWSWGPTDPSVAVLETTGDGNESFGLEPGVDLMFDVTIGTVLAAVVRVVGDEVVSATWFERTGPRVARHPRAVKLVELGLSRRYPDARVGAAVPIAVPKGVDLERRSMDLTLVLADRGTIKRETPLLPVGDLRPFELSVADLPVVRASPCVEVRMPDARGVRIDGLRLDFRGQDRGQGLEVETGRVQPISAGRYTVASMRLDAIGKSLESLGVLSVDEGVTERGRTPSRHAAAQDSRADRPLPGPRRQPRDLPRPRRAGRLPHAPALRRTRAPRVSRV
jgi:hypothetical protein